MARIRTIKPEFWTSEQVMACSPLARLLFIGMWNFCDDGGNHPNAEKTLKALIFPGDDVDSTTVRRLIDELSANDLLQCYEAGGKGYLHVKGWKHQKIERPTFKYPPCGLAEGEADETMRSGADAVGDQSSSNRRHLAPGREGKGKGKGKEKIKSNTPPAGDAAWIRAEEMTQSVAGLSQDVARDYLAHRRAKRAKLTARAWTGISQTLLEAVRLGTTADKVITKAIERGWTGLELEWLSNSGLIHAGGAPTGRSGSLLTNLPNHTPEMYEGNPDENF